MFGGVDRRALPPDAYAGRQRSSVGLQPLCEARRTFTAVDQSSAPGTRLQRISGVYLVTTITSAGAIALVITGCAGLSSRTISMHRRQFGKTDTRPHTANTYRIDAFIVGFTAVFARGSGREPGFVPIFFADFRHFNTEQFDPAFPAGEWPRTAAPRFRQTE